MVRLRREHGKHRALIQWTVWDAHERGYTFRTQLHALCPPFRDLDGGLTDVEHPQVCRLVGLIECERRNRFGAHRSAFPEYVPEFYRQIAATSRGANAESSVPSRRAAF